MKFIGIVRDPNSELLSEHDDTVLKAIISAQNKQMEEAAEHWDRLPATINYYLPEEIGDKTAGIPLIVLSDDPDQEGMLGYHDEKGAGVYGRVFVHPALKTQSGMVTGVYPVSRTISHEVLELWGNPNCNRWRDMAPGRQMAEELCDPVENDPSFVFVGGHSYPMSNYVLPAYFDAQDLIGPFDERGNLLAPFSMQRNGYSIVRDLTTGTIASVFGAEYPEHQKTARIRRAKVGV